MPFDTLRETLLKGGIAPRHVRRYLRELDDHLGDLTEQQRASGYDGEDAAIRARARLGEDSELATAMLARREFRALAARAPWAVFGLLTPLAILLSYTAATLLLVGLVKLAAAVMGENLPHWFHVLAQAVALGSNLGMPVLLGAGLAMLAWRQRLSLGWALLGALLIALAAMQVHVAFPAAGMHGGIGVALFPWWPTALRHPDAGEWLLIAAQSLLAIVPVTVLSFRNRRRTA